MSLLLSPSLIQPVVDSQYTVLIRIQPLTSPYPYSHPHSHRLWSQSLILDTTMAIKLQLYLVEAMHPFNGQPFVDQIPVTTSSSSGPLLVGMDMCVMALLAP